MPLTYDFNLSLFILLNPFFLFPRSVLATPRIFFSPILLVLLPIVSFIEENRDHGR